MTQTLASTGPDAAHRLELAQLRRLEIASVVEATSLTLLVVVAAPLKHLAHFDAAVRVLGPVHGLAFLFYLWSVLQTVGGGGWPRRKVFRLFLAAFIPFAGFLTPKLLRARTVEVASC